MAANDDRFIPSIKPATRQPVREPGQPAPATIPSIESLNEEMRRLWEYVYYLEGRAGAITLRDSLTVQSNLTVSGNESLTGDLAVTGSATGTKHYSCKIKSAVNQNIPSGVITVVTLATTVTDTGFMKSGNTIVLPVSGYWMLGASLIWDVAVGGDRFAAIYKDGVQQVVSEFGAPGGNPGHSVVTFGSFSSGAVVDLRAYQNSGVGLDVLGTLDSTAHLWAQRLFAGT